MPIKREWIDPKLVGTVAGRHCKECDKDAVMEYVGSYLRTDDNVKDMRDIYKCMADCEAKRKWEAKEPDMKWVNPLFSYKRD